MSSVPDPTNGSQTTSSSRTPETRTRAAARVGCEAAAVAALEASSKAGLPPVERLAEIETAVTLTEAWCRMGEAERHFGRIE